MNGLSGLNKSPGGVVVGLAQLQLPVVETPAQLAAQTQKIVDMVGKARRGYAHMDLIVFPEYALHGLSMSTAPDLMVSMDGPEVEAMRQACITHRIWGCFSIMEFNHEGNPYNSGIIIDDQYLRLCPGIAPGNDHCCGICRVHGAMVTSISIFNAIVPGELQSFTNFRPVAGRSRAGTHVHCWLCRNSPCLCYEICLQFCFPVGVCAAARDGGCRSAGQSGESSTA